MNLVKDILSSGIGAGNAYIHPLPKSMFIYPMMLFMHMFLILFLSLYLTSKRDALMINIVFNNHINIFLLVLLKPTKAINVPSQPFN